MIILSILMRFNPILVVVDDDFYNFIYKLLETHTLTPLLVTYTINDDDYDNDDYENHHLM